jgi:uncharacterized protein (DUF2336 family)
MAKTTPAKDRLVRLLGISDHKVSYEQARDLLDHADSGVRLALALRTDLEPEILFFLARDPDVEVRRAIAANTTAPVKASMVLASDNDDEVRHDLADRIGRVIPGLSAEEQASAWRTVHQVLNLLVRDQLPRVRRALADAMKSLPDAPHDIILTLAMDPESSVAAPVLEFSPVLTDEDLEAVIQASPMSAQLVAISKRINVGEEVSQAIVGTGSVDGITALLKNQSAQIREETLDAIIDAAPGHESWHEPLVNRGNLNTKAALRIAEFVADSLVQALAKRADLDAETTESLGEIVRERLRRREEQGGLAQDDPDNLLDPRALTIAQRQTESLAQSGKLTTENVLRMTAIEVTPLAVASLARLADMPLEAVVEVIRAASAKGMLAVAWSADFTAEEAVQLQLTVGRVPPDSVIPPRAGGGFDAMEDELEWQIDMYTDLAKSRASSSA